MYCLKITLPFHFTMTLLPNVQKRHTILKSLSLEFQIRFVISTVCHSGHHPVNTITAIVCEVLKQKYVTIFRANHCLSVERTVKLLQFGQVVLQSALNCMSHLQCQSQKFKHFCFHHLGFGKVCSQTSTVLLAVSIYFHNQPRNDFCVEQQQNPTYSDVC
jgi:hypothetical protein